MFDDWFSRCEPSRSLAEISNTRTKARFVERPFSQDLSRVPLNAIKTLKKCIRCRILHHSFAFAMMPIEVFADVASFFAYNDLEGLMLASKLLSAVAKRCVDKLRLFDFSCFGFYIHDAGINVYRLHANGDYGPLVCSLELTSEENMTEFISEAFRNCTVGRFLLRTHHKHVQHAIQVVASTTTVAGTLFVSRWSFENVQGLFEFVDAFRCVKVTHFCIFIVL